MKNLQGKELRFIPKQPPEIKVNRLQSLQPHGEPSAAWRAFSRMESLQPHGEPSAAWKAFSRMESLQPL
jgi:hypothetical protein